MKKCLQIVVCAIIIACSHGASASQADDTTIRITGQTPGASPFISKVSLAVSNTSALKNVQFTITPKAGSVTRPLSGTYATSYLIGRGYANAQTGNVVLPVYGLYDGYTNSVKLTFSFLDGSSKQINTRITTAGFQDPCGYKTPTVLQRRTNSTALSYDFMMTKGGCNDFQPTVIDTDGAVRWVGTGGISAGSAIFFDNAAYMGVGRKLVRIDLDGTVTDLADYSDLGITDFHHNIDIGKFGIILDANTTSYYNSVNIEVDASGRVLKVWNLATIISAAMIAGGDDPSEFVHPTPIDWFHNNAVAYNRADDSIVVSSRENFLICLDYNTGSIKWILGDTSKKWYRFPSLRKFALRVPAGSIAPSGQHGPSITADHNLLMLDNGQPGRFYSTPRKYTIDVVNKVATEVWNFPMNQSIYCPFCGSVYEDAPNNYLIDYAIVNGGLPGRPTYAQLLGVDARRNIIFSYRYPAVNCGTIYRALPVHLENTKFPTVGPQPLNLSTRGNVTTGDGVLIGGFVITGTEPKTIVIRALGPSLSHFGVSGVLDDPILKLYNSSHTLIATNDNWQTDPHNADIQKNGLAPPRLTESATLQTLPPGAYTVVVSGKESAPGVGLVELYDLSPLSNSKLANMSTRGAVGTGDDALISGFIVGDVGNTTVVVRALGPSLARYGVSGALSDPTLTIYDSTGAVVATNDNWRDNVNAIDIQKNALSPPNERESALVLHLPAGSYTAVVRGANGGTGIGLAEVYTLQ